MLFRSGSVPDEAVYLDSLRRRRDLSVLLLLDISGSSAEPGTLGRTVHEQQRTAVANLTVALHDLGDRSQFVGRLHRHAALIVPPDDVTEIGEGDAGIFFEHAIRRDAEPRSTLGDLVQPCLRSLTPPPLQPA